MKKYLLHLPPKLHSRLKKHSRSNGQQMQFVMIKAITLFLDSALRKHSADSEPIAHPQTKPTEGVLPHE